MLPVKPITPNIHGIVTDTETVRPLHRPKRDTHQPSYLSSPCGLGDSDIDVTVLPPSEGFPLPDISSIIAETSVQTTQVKDAVVSSQ